MRRWLVGAAVTTTALVFLVGWLGSRQQKTWTTHPAGVASATMYRLQLAGNPEGLVPTKDGGVFYFVRGLSNVGQVVGEIRPDGKLQESVVPSRDDISSMALGADGALWALVDVDSASTPHDAWPKVGLARVAIDHVDLITQLQISGPGASLQLGPDRLFWYAFPDHHAVASSKTTGLAHSIGLDHKAAPTALAFDNHGHLFAASGGQPKMAMIAAADAPSTLTLPNLGSQFGALAAGPDGDVWFTDTGANAIGRVTADQHLEEIPVAEPLGKGGVLAVDSKSVWFALHDGLGRYSKASRDIANVTLPASADSISSIAVADRGTVWVALNGVHGGNICLSTCGGIVRVEP